MFSLYICRNCGAEYGEKQEENFCSSCFENEVYSADSAMSYWEDDDY
jgi:hypothetical protein